MTRIPRKYFKAENLGEALLNLRLLMASGHTVQEIAQEITVRYSKADAEEKAALGKLLTAAYDFEDMETARKCGEMFGALPSDKTDPPRTISYQIVRDHFNDLSIPWLEEYCSEKCRLYRKPAGFKNKRYWMVVPTSERGNVVEMAQDIYWILEPSLTVNFLALVDCDLDMLIDEELFSSGSAPLYFTESSHFVSPVYKVKVAKKILEYFLEKVGFPNVEIKMNVVFTTSDGALINKEDYLPGGLNEKDWEGVKVYDYESLRNLKDFLLHSCNPDATLLTETSEAEFAMLEALINSLHATSTIFNELYIKDKLHQHEKSQLTRMAKKLELFQTKE